MKSRLFCSRGMPVRAISCAAQLVVVVLSLCFLACLPNAVAGDTAPPWMHALVSAPLPAYDEKTDAVLLYSETNVTVISADKVRTQVREAYKILRPNGREHGTVLVYFNPQRRVKSIHGWCIPSQGKDYEVKDKDAVEVAPNTDGAELISDVKYKLLRIPAPDVGNIVGYEYEVEEQSFFLQDMWHFQQEDPVRESHYSLQLPSGWEYKASWLNHPEIAPTQSGGNLSQWALSDVKGIRREAEMPPRDGVAGSMIVTFFPPGGAALRGFANWNDMGKWYTNLLGGRVEASAEIKQQVASLTASKETGRICAG
jgi:hypothetical protein